MTAKMRMFYITCALLAVAVGSFASDSPNNVKSEEQPKIVPSAQVSPVSLENSTKVDVTTAVPAALPVQPPTSSVVANSSDSNNSTTNATTAQPTAPVTTPTKPTTTVSTPTTPISTKAPSVPTTTTVLPTTGKHLPTTVPPSASTTAVPSTMPPSSTPSSHKERHFDGLSFIGGMILTTSLIAIAAFSWKFYRTCNEGNYRTL